MTSLLISITGDLDHLGIKGLHLHLQANGIRSFLLYMPVFQKQSDWSTLLTNFILEKQPCVVGISLMANDYDAACEVTAAIKKNFPELRIVWGGIFPTTMPELCAKHADYVCAGEGERALVDMVNEAKNQHSLDNINNLCYWREGRFVRNPLYPLIENLDELPVGCQIPVDSYVLLPRRIEAVNTQHLRRYRRYRGALYRLLTSRGCPHDCSYCCNNVYRKLYGRWPVRRRTVEHVLGELSSALKEGPTVEYVDLTDDCFVGNNIEYLDEFAAKYKTRVQKPFIVKGTARYFTRKKMDLLFDAGLAWVNMGLQSGSDRVCEEVYNRHIESESFLEAARLISAYPVGVYYDVIVDNPLESLEDKLATVDVLTRTPKPYYLLILSLTFFHGTELRERVLREIPAAIEDPRHKNILKRSKDKTTEIIEITPFLPAIFVRYLVKIFRKYPNSIYTWSLMFSAKAICHFCLAPLTYLRLIWRSQSRSLWRTLKVLPIFFDHAVFYYLYQFGTFKRHKNTKGD